MIIANQNRKRVLYILTAYGIQNPLGIKAEITNIQEYTIKSNNTMISYGDITARRIQQ